MKKYVLAFAFSASREDVLLINKLRPDWQAGKVNGVGGKVENGESAEDAIKREFKEETNVDTKYKDWDLFCKMIFENDVMGGSAVVYCYRSFNNFIYDFAHIEAEKPEIFNVKELLKQPEKLMENVPMLINLSLSNFDSADIIKF